MFSQSSCNAGNTAWAQVSPKKQPSGFFHLFGPETWPDLGSEFPPASHTLAWAANSVPLGKSWGSSAPEPLIRGMCPLRG